MMRQRLAHIQRKASVVFYPVASEPFSYDASLFFLFSRTIIFCFRY